MKIDRILYTHTYQIGLSNWEKIGMEATLEEGEDHILALKVLREEVDKAHRSYNHHLSNGKEAVVESFMEYGTMMGEKAKYGYTDVGANSYTKPLVINREYERVEILIGDCKTKEELMKHKEYCDKHPDMMPIYATKFKELTKIEENV